jgi:hypothetical protein
VVRPQNAYRNTLPVYGKRCRIRRVSNKKFQKGEAVTSITAKRLKEITNVAKELPDNELNELLDFARFLKVKRRGFSYNDVVDSAQYTRELRTVVGTGSKSGEAFVQELIEWQDSNS